MIRWFEAAATMNPYAVLGAAILVEVFGTVCIKLSEGFTRPLPVVGVFVGYGVSFYLFSLTLEELPVGLTYATWASVGIVCIATIDVVVFEEAVDLPGIVGLLLIVVGVYVLNVVSDMSAH